MTTARKTGMKPPLDFGVDFYPVERSLATGGS